MFVLEEGCGDGGGEGPEAAHLPAQGPDLHHHQGRVAFQDRGGFSREEIFSSRKEEKYYIYILMGLGINANVP